MSSVREAWTDERLDDLSDRMDRGFDRAHDDVQDLRRDMDRGFDRVDRDLRGVRAEIGSLGGGLRGETKSLGSELRSEIGELNARFDAMYRTMVYGGCGIIGAVVASIAATLLT